MPKRTDIDSILIIGAGPIIIGQACEFDYSGVQACRALRAEGYRIILVNSNPATIMTDPDMADATYIEPLNSSTLEKIMERERPQALLPTMGGQTALNCALDLAAAGVLEAHGVELIGASREAIDKAEDREKFRDAMQGIGLSMPCSVMVDNLQQLGEAEEKTGFPVIIRPSFTLGGSGGGIAWNREQLMELCRRGLDVSPVHRVLLEQSVLGWKEFEMEVVRDRKDNCIIVCTIENLDPMGVHTGDSITVAPAQTLTDREYQRMRSAAIAVLREIGVDTGGSNVQFALHPDTGEMVVIEMNPRVSRSSALASKATGFPIAKVAARLAVGYTLDELGNEILGNAIPASFEPSIDYVVTKMPRFAFEKFPMTDSRLGTQMKSVGEVMAIGSNFQQSLQKALRGLETRLSGLDEICLPDPKQDMDRIRNELREPRAERLRYVADALRAGMSIEEVHALSAIDPWFLVQIADLIATEETLRERGEDMLDGLTLRMLKRKGFSDARIATLVGTEESSVRTLRWLLGVRPVYRRVDSCAAEFPATTAYMYSCYEEECEARPETASKIVVLGSGPNRIGQGIEFDYCCVQAAMAMRESGYQTIMINCNPETVSTDYDIADRLYFEPLCLEDVLEVVSLEKPEGVIVQYGGQTPLALAKALAACEVPIIGTSPDSIDLAEDRDRFQALVKALGIRQPDNQIAYCKEQALESAASINWPLVVRPSYVLGGRSMEIVYDEEQLAAWIDSSTMVFERTAVLLDHFLSEAVEVDVDIVCDGKEVFVAGIMEHIEQAGVHSGDSACSLPPFSLSSEIVERLAEQACRLALGLKVSGLMNVQFAVKEGEIYVLEANPRASRTIPFVSKAIGIPLAKVGARCMSGQSLHEQGISGKPQPPFYAVKESVFPFAKFPGTDPLLGPEMKSTGEVMGVGRRFDIAFAKSQEAAGQILPMEGRAFISVRDSDKPAAVALARELVGLGFTLCATHGTAAAIRAAGIECERVNKVREGQPHIVDRLKNAQISLIVNTTEGKKAIADSFSIRSTALQYRVCYTTTMAGARATVAAIGQREQVLPHMLQSLHEEMRQ